ncbi:MAG: hypothetical protein ACJA2C_002770 [Marinoscillum sp.]|jgi:hypothetical protein
MITIHSSAMVALEVNSYAKLATVPQMVLSLILFV